MAAAADAIALAEALKSEGNSYFKLRQYEQAVRAYTAALERLSGAASATSARQVEAAVRLNRAWAILEAGGDNARLWMAERDCSEVLVMDVASVKALYRRALARERLGDYHGAMADAQRMSALEPANPSVEPLVARLELLMSKVRTSSKVAHVDETLATKMDRVSIAEASEDSSHLQERGEKATKEDADAVWRALQEEERSLRRAYTTTAPKIQQHPPRRVKSKPTVDHPSHDRGEICSKTDTLWALLEEEEVNTVAKVFSRSSQTHKASRGK